MKKSLIWTAISVGVIGIGVPAFAAVQTNKPQPAVTTVNSVEDRRGNCDEAEHANDPQCATIAVPVVQPNTPVTQPTTSIDDSTNNSIDDSTNNSIDDSTSNTVEDISGNCDEAEHANDPGCTSAAVPGVSVDDSGHHNGGDDSGHHNGGADDSGHHNGGDDSGHGGNDD